MILKLKRTIKLIIALDDIRSHHNVGSVFRSADAFGIELLLLGGITAAPPHRDIQKTALGATESVEWEAVDLLADRIEEFKKDGYRVIVIEQHENSIPMPPSTEICHEKILIIMGNEVKGVKESIIDIADEVWEIPQHGIKKSLNVSVCAGICMHNIIGY